MTKTIVYREHKNNKSGYTHPTYKIQIINCARNNYASRVLQMKELYNLIGNSTDETLHGSSYNNNFDTIILGFKEKYPGIIVSINDENEKDYLPKCLTCIEKIEDYFIISLCEDISWYKRTNGQKRYLKVLLFNKTNNTFSFRTIYKDNDIPTKKSTIFDSKEIYWKIDMRSITFSRSFLEDIRQQINKIINITNRGYSILDLL